MLTRRYYRPGSNAWCAAKHIDFEEDEALKAHRITLPKISILEKMKH